MKKSNIFLYLFSFSLIICTLLTVVDFACFDKSFYKMEYENNNTASIVKTDNDGLEKITDKLLGYLKNDYDSLDLKVTINGELKEVFNQREKDHMVDVKNLYISAMTLRNLFILLTILFLLIIIYQRNFFEIKKIYLKTLIFFGVIMILLIIYIIIDFDTFWTSFHHIFFSGNDLWLLDPSVDVLIMLVPGEFFNDLVLRILLMFIFLISLYYFLFKLIKMIYNLIMKRAIND